MKDLVAKKKLDANKTDDPWGKPFKVLCSGENVHVVSCGKDGQEGTADDVRDDFTASDIHRVANL